MNFKFAMEVITGTLGLLFIVWCIALIPRLLYVESQCLKLGYREAHVDWAMRAYCVTRVEQTDVVIPLGEARRNSRKGAGP